MGESSFWYRPTRVVPDQRPLNGRCSLQSSVLDADAVPGFLVEIMFSQLQPVYCDLLDSLMAQ